MKVFATYNVKGGVGKTAATVNLAHLASRAGYRCVIWDLDPQGAAGFYFRIEPTATTDPQAFLEKKRGLKAAVHGTNYAGLDLIPADLGHRNLDIALSEFRKPTTRLGKLLSALEDDYDLAFVDCAPHLSLVSENIFEMADWLLVPVIPTPLSVRAYAQLGEFSTAHGLPRAKLLPFFSMVDRRRQLHCELITQFAADHPEVLRSFIPYTSQVEKMGEQRAPVQTFAAGSPGARAFYALWQALCERIGLDDGSHLADDT
jgi:cellulose biosynthesis protein BcsQ